MGGRGGDGSYATALVDPTAEQLEMAATLEQMTRSGGAVGFGRRIATCR